MEANRNEKILKKETTALLVIDIQERIIPVIDKSELMIENSVKLIKGMQILDCPVLFTEQYPKGLGTTISELTFGIKPDFMFQKDTFSCVGSEDLMLKLNQLRVSQIVICGIETHVCVQQTALDLIANGYLVYIVADAVSSRKKIDYSISLERMSKHGADILTTESCLFELLEFCGTPQFKLISQLIK